MILFLLLQWLFPEVVILKLKNIQDQEKKPLVKLCCFFLLYNIDHFIK